MIRWHWSSHTLLLSENLCQGDIPESYFYKIKKLSLYCGKKKIEQDFPVTKHSALTIGEPWEWFMAVTWLQSLNILAKVFPPIALCSHPHGGQDPVFLINKRLKTFCTALQLALTCVRVRKGLLWVSSVSKWDSHLLFPHCSPTSFT